MAKPLKTKERFIELRATCMTLAKAAQELGIAYNTASNWQSEFEEDIAAAKAIQLEELIDKYRMTKEKRIEFFGDRLLAVEDELAKRDLSELSTPKLFEMMIRLSKVLEAESVVPEFLSEDDIQNRKEDRELDSRVMKIKKERTLYGVKS